MDAKPKFSTRNFATMTCMRREFIVFPVKQNELNTLASGHTSIHFGLFGIFFGASLTLGITCQTVPLSDRSAVMFFSAFLICVCFAIFTGAMALRAFFSWKKMITEIKGQTTAIIVKQERD